MGVWLVVSGALAGTVPFAGGGHAFHPVWSLDGRHIAFEINRYAGDVELWVTDLHGDVPAPPVRVALPGGGFAFAGGTRVAANPVWDATGGLVFEGTHPVGRVRLYRWSPGAAGVTEVIPLELLAGDLTFPAMAPRSGLAFVAGATGAGDVEIQDATGKIRHLTQSPEAEAFPAFSSDGSRLVFTRRRGADADIVERTIVGGHETVRAGGEGDQTRPSVAAADVLVVFDSSRGADRWDLVAIGPDWRRTLARDVRLPLRARPALSPDGAWVAWVAADPARGRTVQVTQIDGGGTVTIDTPFTACGEPALARQGDRLLLAFTALPSEGAAWRFLTVMDVSGRW